MKATRVSTHQEAEAHGPGAFYYRFDENGKPKHLTFVLPNAVKDEEGSYFRSYGGISLGGDGWSVDGNLDAPTCSPSIFVNPPHGWHGFLRNGEFVDA